MMTDAERELNMRRFPPGSAQAVLMGCKCSQRANDGGRGFYTLTSLITGEKEAQYVVDMMCPMHTETPEILEGWAEGLT